jgi:hypothetical protein
MTTAERLDRLERRSTWVSRVMALIVAAVAVFFLSAQGCVPRDIDATSLRLWDRSGKLRATLGTHRDSAKLAFYDNDGGVRVVLHTTDGLTLSKGGKSSRTVVDASEGFRIDDENGATRILVGLKSGLPRLLFLDQHHGPRVALSDVGDGNMELVFYKGDGARRIRIGLDADGGAVIIAADKNGEVIWRARGGK